MTLHVHCRTHTCVDTLFWRMFISMSLYIYIYIYIHIYTHIFELCVFVSLHPFPTPLPPPKATCAPFVSRKDQRLLQRGNWRPLCAPCCANGLGHLAPCICVTFFVRPKWHSFGTTGIHPQEGTQNECLGKRYSGLQSAFCLFVCQNTHI